MKKFGFYSIFDNTQEIIFSHVANNITEAESYFCETKKMDTKLFNTLFKIIIL